MPRHRLPILAAVALLAAVPLTGCGSDDTGSSGSSTTSAGALKGTINVFAAASLKEAFTILGTQFEAAHPGTKVVFNFGPSSGLATNIASGSPADVFASASAKNMDQVVTASLAKDPKTFAKNQMEIAVPAANPAKIDSVDDLAAKDVKVALCQSQVPCGTVAAKVFDNAKVTVTPVSEEVDVKAVLAKVSLGEVDAGMVYVTDVQSAGEKVKGVEIPADVNASTSYPIATLTKSANPTTAAAFTAYVLSSDGQTVLTKGGFRGP